MASRSRSRPRAIGGIDDGCQVAKPAPEFVALSLPAPHPSPTSSRASGAPTQTIRLELKRVALGVSVVWPVSAATDCAAWLRELLR